VHHFKATKRRYSAVESETSNLLSHPLLPGLGLGSGLVLPLVAIPPLADSPRHGGGGHVLGLEAGHEGVGSPARNRLTPVRCHLLESSAAKTR